MPASATVSSPTEIERSAVLEVSFHSPLPAVIIFLIPTLGGHLEFQYQSQKKSLLEEHGQIMVTIFLNLFLYGVGLMVEFKLKARRSRCLSIVRRLTLLVGILVVVLITILLYPVRGLIAFGIWALFTLEAVLKLFQEILQWLRPMFILAKETVTSHSNGAENRSSEIREIGFAGVEANDLARQEELPL